MALFRLEDYEPVPTDEFYMIEEFKALFTLAYNKGVDGDSQGRNRKRGHQEARFLYFNCDYRSEFARFSILQRMEEALSAAGLETDYVISDELRAAIGRYEKLRDSRSLRMVRSAWKAIDKLQLWLDNVDFDDPKYDTKEVSATISNLDKLVTGLQKLELNIKAEEGQEAGAKGQAEKGRLD